MRLVNAWPMRPRPMKPRSCLSCAMAGQPCLRERALSIRSLVRILERLVPSVRNRPRPRPSRTAHPWSPLPLTPADPYPPRMKERPAGQSEAVCGDELQFLEPDLRSSCWKRGSPRRLSKLACSFMKISHVECSSYTFSSHARAVFRVADGDVGERHFGGLYIFVSCSLVDLLENLVRFVFPARSAHKRSRGRAFRPSSSGASSTPRW